MEKHREEGEEEQKEEQVGGKSQIECTENGKTNEEKVERVYFRLSNQRGSVSQKKKKRQ